MLAEILERQEHLRIGQVGALCALQSHFLGVHRNSAAQVHLPTGYGKTLVMLLAQVMFGGDGQTIVVCGTEALRDQNSANFQELYAEYKGNSVVATGSAARLVLGGGAPKKAGSIKRSESLSPATLHLMPRLLSAIRHPWRPTLPAR